MNKLKSIKLSAVLIWLFILWFSFLAVQPIQAMPHGVKSAIPLRAVIAPDVFTDDNTVNGNCTLREAIIAANTNVAVDACPAGNVGGDTITLSAGTYNLTLTGASEDVAATGDLDILEDLTITGVSSATTIIDAAALSDRVFHVRALGDTANFENVQIVNGQTTAANAHGAGIFLDQGYLTVSDSRIANNQTLGAGSGGGGIYGGGGAIVLTNTEFLSNNATALGGGIQVAIAPLVGSNIRVENNTAVNGGGGINADNVTLNSSEVINNQVTGGSAGGAGINAGTLVMTDTIVADNTTGVNGSGGGVAIALDSTITGGAIYNNTANNDGAGIYVGGGTTTINGTQIYTNTASSQGGGLYINSGSVQMLSGQIDDNEAQNGGGVLVNSGATFSHTGGTIAYNRAPSFPGGGLWVGGLVIINGGQVLSNTSGNVGGGVLISSGGVVELVSGQIDYNQSSGAGAGMWVTDGAVFTQTGGTVAYNSTTNSGAGLWVQGTVWLNGGQVLGNSSTSGNGGGLYLTTNGQVTIDGGEVVSNSAAFDGGGFYLNDITNTLTMNSGTIGYNVANGSGGGVYLNDGLATITNSRILTNTASSNGGAIYKTNGTITIGNSCIVDNSDTAVVRGGGVDIAATGNWWGAADGPSGVAVGNGDSVSNNVDYASYLSASILGCPTISNPPHNITIVAGAALVNMQQVGNDFVAVGDDAQLGVDDIVTALGSGDVAVYTGVPGTGVQSGTITITGYLDFDGIGVGNTLTLSAAHNIVINNSITDTVAGGDALNLILQADVDNDGSGGITVDAVATVDSQAAITMTANTIIFSSGAQIAGTDTLRLQPRESTANFSLGGETINSLVDGFSQITIGRDDSSGQISLAPNLPTFYDPVLIQSPAAGGTIDTNSDVLGGQGDATITLLADQTITAFRIENPNRAITVTSLSGNIIVNERIDTANLPSGGTGGPVVLSAATTITVVGAIETRAGFGSGDGGEVTISAGNDVELSYITSGTGGTLVAGDVQVTGRYVRLINTANNGCSNFSGVCAIWSEGSNQAGVITITHQGNGIVPFIVGDATTNGANGALFGGAVIEEMPAKTYYGSHTEFGPPDVYIVTNAPPPDVAISKTVFPTSAAPGDTITYTIAYTNNGPIVATNMVITDTFPVSVTTPTVNNSGPMITQTSGYPTYSWQVADMSAGQSGVITLSGQVVATATAGLMDNVVEITATGDMTSTNNSATATLTVSGGDCYATHDDGTTVFNSADASAVQDAVDAAPAGGTVKVAGYCAGVQTLAGSDQTVYISKTLTVRGGYTTTDWTTSSLSQTTILDAQTTGRVIYVTGAVNVQLDNLRVTNGRTTVGTDHGAGIYNNGATLTLDSLRVYSNTLAGGGADGGAIYSNETITIRDSQVYSNTSPDLGGGMSVNGADFYITNSQFDHNRANEGAAIYYTGGTGYLTSTVIISNAATAGRGGGIRGNNNIHLTDSTISYNTASVGGGAMFISPGTVYVTNSTVADNTANAIGGGLWIQSDIYLTNSTVRGNRANGSSGGLFVNTGTAYVTNSTIQGNSAMVDGGGLFINSSMLYMTGTTVISNVSDLTGGGLRINRSAYITNSQILYNTANTQGGGLYINGAGSNNDQIQLVNSLIAGNVATNEGQAIYLQHTNGDDTTTIRHTTIANPVLGGGQALYLNDGTLNINNSIIVNYTTGIERVGGTANEDYNLFFGNSSNTIGTINSGGNSLTGDPLFVNPAGNDYHLSIGSAAIDAGIDLGVTTDFEGDVRPYLGSLPDIGYDESSYVTDVAINKTVTPITAAPGDTITYTISFTNTGSSTVSNVMITDIIPAGIDLPLSIVPSGPPITPIAGPTYAWTVDPLSAGQSGSIIMTGQVATSAPAGTIINTAEITATGDITSANNNSPIILTIIAMTPTLVINNVTGSEADGLFNFTLALTATSFNTVTVDYITQDQTATAGADYQGSSGTLSWPPGTLTNTIGVVVLDDTLDEATETFSLLFSNLTNAQFATTAANAPITSATGTILDDDFYPDITLSDATGLENSDWLTFTVNLNAATNLTVTVSYATQDETATTGLDYLSVSGSLIIPPGELSQPLTVTLVDDLLAEDNETFTLTLTAASNAYIVDGTGLGTIIDNETGVDLRLTKTVTPTTVLPGDWLTYTLTFSNAGPAIAQQVVITDLLPAQLTGVNYQAAGVTVTPTAGLTHVWTVDDLATNAGGSLTINGQVQPTITATTLNNTAVIDSQTTEQDATNNQASASVAIGNLPQLSFEPATYQVDEAAGRVTVTVQLDGSPATTGASVGYTTQDGTALAGLDYLTATGRLTFTAGLTQQQFTVPISDDAFVELEETVQLSLSNPRGAALNLSTAILSIIDNDTAGIQLRPLSLTVTEAGANDRYNLRLASAPQSPVTITIQATNGQVDPLPGKIFFTRNNWQISQTVIISAVDDLAVEGFHNDSLTHLVTSDDPAYAGLTVSPVEVVIRDNDFPAVSFSQAAYLVAEGAGSAQITVQLSDSPWLTATVDYQTTPGSATPDQDYRPVSGTLRFLPGTTALQWVIPISDDTLIESPETVNLSLLNPVNSSLTTPLTAVLTISDTDQLPPLAVTIQDSAPISTGSGLTLTVTPSDNATPLSYRWQFGDGTPQVTISQLSVNHTYLSPGIYTVIVTATDGSRVANDTITVIVDDPIQGLTATHTAPTLSNNPISFTASITQGTNVAGEISYSWDFGDGTTGIGPQPTHSYTSPGTYQVVVKATNSLGTVTTSITIVVGDGGSGTTDDLLEVRHFVSASQVTAGEFMTYQTIVLNVSQQAATSVVIRHDWPADADGQPAFHGFINEGAARELSVAQVSGSQTAKSCTLQGAQLRCQIEELPAGSRVTINLMLSPRLSGTLVSRVTATATETDLTPANNLVEVTTEVLPETPATPSETVVTAANRPSRVYLPVVVKP